MDDDLLIELVKQNPYLYNTCMPEYRHRKSKSEAWDYIAEQLNANVEEVRSRWGKLRNCYTNALRRRQKKGAAAVHLIPWKHEVQMGFLLPYLEGNQTYIEYDDDTMQELFSDEPTVIKTKKTSSVRTTSPTTLLNSLSNRLSTNDDLYHTNNMTEVVEMDVNDYFFLSMSRQLKKLHKTEQSVIKFQLHTLVHDATMKMLKNENKIKKPRCKVKVKQYRNVKRRRKYIEQDEDMQVEESAEIEEETNASMNDN